MPDFPRYFAPTETGQLIGGGAAYFRCDTENDTAWVRADGSECRELFCSLVDCLQGVADGRWIEITADDAASLVEGGK